MKRPDLERWINKKGKRNPRVGRGKRTASHTVGTSFRHLAPVDVSVVQRWYATGYFTQAELAKIFDVSRGIISKCCRCVRVAKVSYLATPKKDKRRTA
jgi:hypothetical protein